MILSKLCSKILVLFTCWIILSTILPYIFPINSKSVNNLDGYLNSAYYNLNTPTILNNNLTNSNIILITAHPDDESMFFTPTLIELSKKNYNNTINVLCFSNGGFDGLGDIRTVELEKTIQLLRLDGGKVLDYEDNISKMWDTKTIEDTLFKEISLIHSPNSHNTVLITFDEEGVSNHPNHISLYYGVSVYAKNTGIRMFKLKTWSIWVKFTGILVTNIELITKWILRFRARNSKSSSLLGGLKFFEKYESRNIFLYIDFNSWFLGLSTMTWAHYSQIVWFRWFWIFLSKYMNSNELIRVE